MCCSSTNYHQPRQHLRVHLLTADKQLWPKLLLLPMWNKGTRGRTEFRGFVQEENSLFLSASAFICRLICMADICGNRSAFWLRRLKGRCGCRCHGFWHQKDIWAFSFNPIYWMIHSSVLLCNNFCPLTELFLICSFSVDVFAQSSCPFTQFNTCILSDALNAGNQESPDRFSFCARNMEHLCSESSPAHCMK